MTVTDEAALDAEAEHDANRFAAVVLSIVVVLMFFALITGMLGAYNVPAHYFLSNSILGIFPCLAVAVWSFRRRHVGAGIKYGVVAALIAVASSSLVAHQFGFSTYLFSIVIACRYFRSRFVWGVFAAVVAASFIASIPHAAWGCMTFTFAEGIAEPPNIEAIHDLPRFEYWKLVMLWEWPSWVLSYFVMTIIGWRICIGGRQMLARQRAILQRLADVERGLAIAAAQHFGEMGKGTLETLGTMEDGEKVPPQPDVRGWTTRQISECLAVCRRRAAEDPAFAALIERDPAAAVRAVSANLVQVGCTSSWIAV